MAARSNEAINSEWHRGAPHLEVQLPNAKAQKQGRPKKGTDGQAPAQHTSDLLLLMYEFLPSPGNGKSSQGRPPWEPRCEEKEIHLPWRDIVLGHFKHFVSERMLTSRICARSAGPYAGKRESEAGIKAEDTAQQSSKNAIL